MLKLLKSMSLKLQYKVAYHFCANVVQVYKMILILTFFHDYPFLKQIEKDEILPMYQATCSKKQAR